MRKKNGSQRKHTTRHRKAHARRNAHATGATVIPIAVHATTRQRAARSRQGNRREAGSPVIPVVLESGAASADLRNRGIPVAADAMAVIPVAVDSPGRSTAGRKRLAGKKAVIPIAVMEKGRAATRRAGRKRTVAAKTKPAQVALKSPGLFERGVSSATEVEKNTVDTAGAVGLLTLDVLQTAALLAVQTPAALLGIRPAELPRRREHLRVAPQFSALPAMAA